jgi:hypothetical protein
MSIEGLKVYHKKPDNLKGDTLYPLNQLKEIYPEVYAEEIKKYTEEGRVGLMNADVIPLGVKWNDVVHLTPIHPDQIRDALSLLGRHPNLEHIEVDASRLDSDNTTIYVDSGDPIITPEDFHPYTPENLKRFSELSQKTKDYYRQEVEKGERPLLHKYAPHVLHKGPIKLK